MRGGSELLMGRRETSLWQMTVRSIAVALIAFSLSACRRSRELSETLTWMHNTYNPQSVTRAPGHGRMTTYEPASSNDRSTRPLFFGTNITFTYDGCNITLNVEADPAGTLSRHTMLHNSVVRFNLHEIDPQSITMLTTSSDGKGDCETLKPDEPAHLDNYCDGAMIKFRTHGEAPLIVEQIHTIYPDLKGSDHDARSTVKETAAYLGVDDIAYGSRFAKAFRHAVELCGGTPETF
jgi:hypothetical protein